MPRKKDEKPKKQEEIVWPVKYNEHHIWEAWEVWTDGYWNMWYGIRVPDKPSGQLIITRDKNFYDLDEIGRGFYFNEGYKYFWVNYKSGEWVELTRSEFNDRKCDYRNRTSDGKYVYTLNYAYSEIKAPTYPKSYTYRNYSDYLHSYYPDYMADDVCEVFVLWNKDRLPLVQIRHKCGDKWDMAYPGDEVYVPLKRFYWSNLEHFGRDLGEVEQVYPPECFGYRVGARKERTYMRTGTAIYRTDIPPMPEPVCWNSMSLKQQVALERRYQEAHKYDP